MDFASTIMRRHEPTKKRVERYDSLFGCLRETNTEVSHSTRFTLLLLLRIQL